AVSSASKGDIELCPGLIAQFCCVILHPIRHVSCRIDDYVVKSQPFRLTKVQRWPRLIDISSRGVVSQLHGADGFKVLGNLSASDNEQSLWRRIALTAWRASAGRTRREVRKQF